MPKDDCAACYCYLMTCSAVLDDVSDLVVVSGSSFIDSRRSQLCQLSSSSAAVRFVEVHGLGVLIIFRLLGTHSNDKSDRLVLKYG